MPQPLRQRLRSLAALATLAVVVLAAAPVAAQDRWTAPEPLSAPSIAYPAGLSRAVTGVVELRFTVTAAGSATDFTVLGSNDPAFAAPVIEALRRVPFAPARKNGIPAAAQVEITIEVPIPPPPPPAAELRGVVYELGTRKRLAGAQVAVAETGAVTTTADDGSFRLALAVTTATLVVSAPGYELGRYAEAVSAGERLEVVYRLKPEGLSPLELVVTAERERAEVSRVRLATAEIRSVPGTFDDAIRVVQRLPSVAQPNEIAGDLLVRGADARDTKIYLDGVEVPFVFHFGAVKSVLASDLIQEVVLYPSNFSVRYGDAIGGVLDVRVRDPEGERWTGRAMVSTFLSEAVAEGPIAKSGNTHLQIAGRSSYAELFVGALIPERSGVNFNVLPSFRDYQLRLVHRAGPWTLHSYAFGAFDRLGFLVERERQVDTASSFNSLDFRWQQNVVGTRLSYAAGIVTGETLLAVTLFDQDFTFANGEFLGFRSQDYWLRSDWEARLTSWLALAAGIDQVFRHFAVEALFPRLPRPGEFDYDFVTVERLRFDEAIGINRTGLYSEARLGGDSGVRGALGLRLDVDGSTRIVTADPRGLLFVPVGDVGTFKAGLGVYHQFAQGQELSSAPIGNRFAGPNRAFHALIGWQRDLVWRLSASVEAFARIIDHLITENPDPFGSPRFNNWGKGRAYGFEATLRRALADTVYGWVNYSFTRSLVRQFPGEPFAPFEFDQPHILNLVLTWVPTAHWEFGGALRYASGNPRDEVAETLYFADQTVFIPVFSDRQVRQSDFFRLDLRSKYTWLFERWTLAALLELLNTTNRSNPLFVSFNAESGEEDEVAGLPIFPYIGVEARF